MKNKKHSNNINNNVNLYNSLNENWNNVLNEWYSQGLIQEGLSDLWNGLKKDAKQLKYDTIGKVNKNGTSDELEKKERTSQGNPRSKLGAAGITLLNSVGRFLAGGNGKWEDVEGGLFDKDRREGTLHSNNKNTLAKNAKTLVSYVINSTLTAYLIKTYCKPTKFTLTQINQNDPNPRHRIVQLCREKGAVDDANFDPVSNQNMKEEDSQNGLQYPLQQEAMVIKNWLLKEGGINPNFNNQYYMWLYQEIINEIKITKNVGTAKNNFDRIVKELGAIDAAINRYCYEAQITRLVDAQRDKTIQTYMQKKYKIVSETFDEIVEEMQEGAKTYQLQITNQGLRYIDIASKIFNYNKILDNLAQLKKLTLKEFMGKQNWNQARREQQPQTQQPNQQGNQA